MSQTKEPKDPSARLDYAFDWKTPARNPATGEVSPYLETGETITSKTVTVTKGDAVLDGNSESAGIVTVWVKGGTAGTTSWITCGIVTSAGREDQRTIVLPIAER